MSTMASIAAIVHYASTLEIPLLPGRNAEHANDNGDSREPAVAAQYGDSLKRA